VDYGSRVLRAENTKLDAKGLNEFVFTLALLVVLCMRDHDGVEAFLKLKAFTCCH
jgi:hypothetical protein